MKHLASLLVLVAFATAADAQVNATLLKNKAKTTRDANNTSVNNAGQIHSGAVAPGAPGRPAAVAPVNTVQTQNLQRLQADIAIIKTKTEASAEQKQKLQHDLLTAASGAKPSEDSVRALAESLSIAIADKKIATADQAKLARDLFSIVNCAAMNAEQTDAVVADAKEILVVSGTPKTVAATVGTNMKAIAAELQKGAPTAPAAPAK
jgi:hypothetical protein